MLKKYSKTLIVTTIIILLPVLAGIILWNKLPEQIPTHFNAAGEVDGYGSKAFAVFGLPLMLVAFQWLCAVGSLKMDPKAKNLEGKVFSLVLWIIPVLSIVMNALVYCTALGMNMNVQIIVPLLMGLLMVIIGNWLPKCKPTWTLGIKLPWTLADEDNWNRTHRFAGPVWVVCGLVIMLCALIGGAFLWVIAAALVVMIAAPTVYSFLLFNGKIK
ncbi:MAG: SdpI family protein [Clostridia bacterium]|nr:SdpI family protein [Clostridia bacterium]